MKIIEVDSSNIEIYLNLAQRYEAEFSPITGKRPNEDGLFALDTEIAGDVRGFLLYLEEPPVGLAAIKAKPGKAYEVCEFYIAPGYRRRSLGTRFARALWQRYPGRWEVKQIAGAEYASCFWRQAIAGFTGNGFVEDRYDDPYWGEVTRQSFVSG